MRSARCTLVGLVRRSELAHIVRAASKISGDVDVVIIGSQAILGSYEEDDLPETVTLSREADIAFWDDIDEQKADSVDGAIGEESSFDEMNGYYAQGVSVTTANLPWGWKERLVRFSNSSTRPGIAWCLEPNDLALAKLAAGRDKDYVYVHALLEDGKLDADVLIARAPTMTISPLRIRQITKWIEAQRKGFRS